MANRKSIINQESMEIPDADGGQTISWLLVVYVEPLLCSIGFLLNCACVAVFLSVSNNSYFRKTSLLTYLVALSICNALQLLLSLFVIVLPAIEQGIAESDPGLSKQLKYINEFSVRIGYPFTLAANYAAIWLLTLICAQRFQAICHPSHPWKKRLSLIRNSRIAVIVVVLMAIGLNVIRFWELEWDSENGMVKSTPLRGHFMYKIIQEGIVYGIIVYGLPILMLLWLNLNILSLIRHDQLHVAPGRRGAETRTALMTVCVFLFFFTCSTLSASIRLFFILAGDISPIENWQWLIDLSNLLMNINALVTPILCYIFTRGFKDLYFVIRRPDTKSLPFPEMVPYDEHPTTHTLMPMSGEYSSI